MVYGFNRTHLHHCLQVLGQYGVAQGRREGVSVPNHHQRSVQRRHILLHQVYICPKPISMFNIVEIVSIMIDLILI